MFEKIQQHLFTTTTAYFPPLAWFVTALKHEDWTLEAYENYQKGSWRNRCRILTANGPLLLSVPLVGGKHQQMPIREVAIDYTQDWQRQHAQTIRSAYGRAPYFEYYSEALLAAATKRPVTLYEYNALLIQQILNMINVKLALRDTMVFQGAAAGAKQVDNAISPYRQVFEDRFGFTEGLSVLDGLFCLGPELITL